MLNEEQEAALSAALAAYQRHEKYFVLSGSAGTGKTFTCRQIYMKMAVEGGLRVHITAPTNKAVKVLQDTMPEAAGEFSTTYSVLGLRLSADGELKKIKSGNGAARVHDYDVVVVDEASMVNKELMSHIVKAAKESNVFFIFMGDPAQLPPVKEDESPVWTLGAPTVQLRKVMRHDNQILNLCTRLRNVIEGTEEPFKVLPDNNGKNAGGVWVLAPDDFDTLIFKFAQQRTDLIDGKAKYIAWRNRTVAEYNWMLRQAIFGRNSVRFEEGERVVFAGPLAAKEIGLNGKEYKVNLASTDDEGTVEAVRHGSYHPEYDFIKVLEVDIVLDFTGEKVTALVLDESSRAQHDDHLAALAEKARQGSSYFWKDFWDFKDAFNDVRYAYAITSHRAQGSTYQTVFVDMPDIFANRNNVERYKSFYVACSRPSTSLVLKGRAQ